jgi:type IX secretion system PorP/SprF family membrane protein
MKTLSIDQHEIINTMNKIKHQIALLLFFWIALFMTNSGYAQQHPIFTQYMFNGLVINPAYSGTHESLSLTGSFRRQWSGIKDAPQTSVFTAHSPINFSRSAAGLVFTQDHLGVTNQYTMYGTYAYHIPVSLKAKVSVGLQAGATYYYANFDDLVIVNQNGTDDDAFVGNDSRVLPNLGLGAYYYSKRVYVGLSIPTLVNNKWNNMDPMTRATQERHYFLTAGYVFDLNPDLKLKPNILLRWVENGPFQYDINANLLIKETVWVGVSYRMRDSIDGLLQWNINDQLSVGYSYGYPTTKISSLQAGTHELVLNFRVKKNKQIVLSPRYF